VRYNATGDDATNLNGEYLTLKNTGTVAINLSGWRVYADAAQVFPLPAYHLAAGATVYVHTGSGTTRAEHVYLGRTSPIWDNTGRDLAIVYDARRAVVSRWFKRFFPVSGCRTWYQSAHHDYPATDVFADKGCRVLAAAAGRVDEVEYVDRWSPTTNYGKDRGGPVRVDRRLRRRPLLRVAPRLDRAGHLARRPRHRRAAHRPGRNERVGALDTGAPALRSLLADPPGHLVGTARHGADLLLPQVLAGRRQRLTGRGRDVAAGRGRGRAALHHRLLTMLGRTACYQRSVRSPGGSSVSSAG
jgi:hypothetical protein